jgi:membrane protease YdiL (CAAX protease family)
VPLYLTPPDRLAGAALRMCVLTPVVEETLYRVVLGVAVVPALGAWGAVLLSGALFAALHFVYGNPSPENQVGGFLLAWGFLRGGTALLPVGLHAAGNLCALASQLAAWYWLTHPLL